LPVIALAKKEELIFRPHDPRPLRLPVNSEALFLIQRMRDEAHRFAVGYHRTLRSRQQKTSVLDQIPGIGPSTKRRLLRHFGSTAAIKQAPLEELTKLVGKSKAKLLHEHLVSPL
jgi:excinuclease ABC subunit C